MLTFKQRLARYLIGVGIGLVLVYAFFGSRDWLGWTPGNRVLELLQHSQLEVSSPAVCQLKCTGLNEAGITWMIQDGKVLFGESRTREQPLLYVLRDPHDERIKMTFETRDSLAILVKVTREGFSCDCPE